MLVPKKQPKAIITDVDATLTERTTWYELTEQLGGSSFHHADVFMKFQRGEISYQQLKKELFEIWTANGPVAKEKLEQIFQDIPLRGEAISFINTLKEEGYIICLISGSIQMFTEEVAKRFNIKHYYGNSVFHFDENGHWIDFEYTKDENRLKTEQFQDFLKKTKLKPEECLAIGDGDNDLSLFSIIPGIVVDPKSEHLRELAWQEVKYLPRVLQLLKSLK